MKLENNKSKLYVAPQMRIIEAAPHRILASSTGAGSSSFTPGGLVPSGSLSGMGWGD